MKRKIIPYHPSLKPIARQLRQNLTLAEVLLWDQLKRGQMLNYDFDRQKTLDNYIVDFYCKDLMLAIEIDGNSHNYPEIAKNDVYRQKRLEELGIHFLRFSDRDIKTKMREVLLAIQYWIENHTEEKEN